MNSAAIESVGKWLRNPFGRSMPVPLEDQPGPVLDGSIQVSWIACKPRTAHTEMGVEIRLNLPPRIEDVEVTQHAHCLSVVARGAERAAAAARSAQLLRRTIPLPAGASWELGRHSVADDVLVVQLLPAAINPEPTSELTPELEE